MSPPTLPSFSKPFLPASFRTPSPSAPSDGTQSPLDREERLGVYEISQEDIHRWKHAYNRVEIPVMEDDDFMDMVYDVCGTAEKADVEAVVAERIAQRTKDLQEGFDEVRFSLLCRLSRIVKDELQRATFTTALRQTAGLHSNLGFMTSCVPEMVGSREVALVGGPRGISKGIPKKRYGGVLGVHKVRRSLRIANIKTRKR